MVATPRTTFEPAGTRPVLSSISLSTRSHDEHGLAPEFREVVGGIDGQTSGIA